MCDVLTEATCQRRIVGKMGELRLPLAWQGDDVKDCVDGRDELNNWPICGKDETLRNLTTYNRVIRLVRVFSRVSGEILVSSS